MRRSSAVAGEQRRAPAAVRSPPRRATCSAPMTAAVSRSRRPSRRWRNGCIRAIGRPDMIDDPRFGPTPTGWTMPDAIDRVVGGLIAIMDLAEASAPRGKFCRGDRRTRSATRRSISSTSSSTRRRVRSWSRWRTVTSAPGRCTRVPPRACPRRRARSLCPRWISWPGTTPRSARAPATTRRPGAGRAKETSRHGDREPDRDRHVPFDPGRCRRHGGGCRYPRRPARSSSTWRTPSRRPRMPPGRAGRIGAGPRGQVEPPWRGSKRS